MSVEPRGVTGEQLQAARALLRWSQQDLANAATIPLATLKRVEGSRGPARGTYESVMRMVGALEAAGVIFIPENGGGPGVRLRG